MRKMKVRKERPIQYCFKPTQDDWEVILRILEDKPYATAADAFREALYFWDKENSKEKS